MFAKTHQGPIDEYPQTVGEDMDWFKSKLSASAPAATSVFSAELIYKAIQDLIITVEGRQD